MEGEEHDIVLACVVSSALFALLGSSSFSILWAVDWRPWRLYSWIFARKWPHFFQGSRLGLLCAALTLFAWLLVVSPLLLLVSWGSWLILILDRNLIGLAVIVPGTALLLAFYSIMLWWRTRWQSSRVVAVLLLFAVALLCAYELCAVYVTAGSSTSERYSPSGFFFGVSAIALAINMLFICRMLFNGNGLDVDEYVRKAYKYAYSDCVEVGPVTCLPEPPDPNELYPRQSSRVSHLGTLYLGSLSVLLVYSILYGLTAKEARWLGAITSAAVIILDWNMGACLFGFQLLKSPIAALFIAGASRVFLICFGVNYWYLGHCVSYLVMASVLLGAAVCRHLLVTNPSAERRDALQSTVIRLREGFRRKEHNTSSSSSEGCGSSMKRSSSAEAGHLGHSVEAISRHGGHCTSDAVGWNNVTLHRTTSSHEGINSEKSMDSGRPSLVLRSSSCRSVVQDPDVGPSFVEKSFDHNSLVGYSSGGIESQGYDSSTSTSVNYLPDLNLALAHNEKLNDPRIAAMLKKRAKQGDRELTNLLQNKGLDPNFAMMLKDKGLDPTILALLQRSSLDADRDRCDNTDITIIDSNSVDNALPIHISLSEELRLRGLEKWLQYLRSLWHLAAGTPERALVLFSLAFIVETVAVAFVRPSVVKIVNATHQQFEFGICVVLLSPVICLIMAYLRSLQAEDMAMSSKPRKYGFFAWLLSTCVGLLLSFLSKSSVLLGLSLTVPLMVACLSIAVPLWIRNGYIFWVAQDNSANPTGNHQVLGRTEGIAFLICVAVFVGSVISLGVIVSFKPLDELSFKGWNADGKVYVSPYASPVYIGWAMASAIALLTTGVLPVISWFATYRFSIFSAICLVLFAVVLVAFCGVSYLEITNSRIDHIPTNGDFLAALLPLLCIPAILSLCTGLYKWKDDEWTLSRSAYIFICVGLLLLLCAISAVIVIVKPWTVGVAFLLVLLLIVLAIGAIHLWASNNFYLTYLSPIKRGEPAATGSPEGSPVDQNANVSPPSDRSNVEEVQELSFRVASDSFDVQAAGDKSVRGLEDNQDPSVGAWGNTDNGREPKPSQNSDLNGQHRAGKREKLRVRTRSVKQVIRDAKDIIGDSIELSVSEHPNGDAEDPAHVVDGDREVFNLVDIETRQKGRKRGRALTLQTTASGQDDGESECRSDSVVAGGPRTRRQKVAAGAQAPTEKRYNLRRPRNIATVAAVKTSSDTRQSKDEEDGQREILDGNSIPGPSHSVGVVSDDDASVNLMEIEEANTYNTPAPKGKVKNIVQSEEVNGTSDRNGEYGDEVYSVAEEEDDDDDSDEVEHPGEASIGKKLWKFLTT